MSANTILDMKDYQVSGVSYKEMVKLAFLAYAGCYLPSTCLNECRVAHMVAKYAPDHEIVWGPVASKSFPWILTNALVYITKDTKKIEPTYTIVIRGTNMSFSTVIVQDMWVAEQEPWNCASRYADVSMVKNPVVISKGASATMKYLRKLKYKGKTIIDFVSEKLQEDKVTIQITGHSLGGLSTTILSTWLQETLASPRYQYRQDVKSKFKTIAIAPPSPGNQYFTDYVEQLNTANNNMMTRIVNHHDIVSLVWSAEDIAKDMAVLYQSQQIYPNRLEQELIAMLYNMIASDDFVQTYPKHEIPFAVVPTIQSWLMQAIFQHLFSYPLYYLQSSEPQLIREMLLDLSPVMLQNLKDINVADRKAMIDLLCQVTKPTEPDKE